MTDWPGKSSVSARAASCLKIVLSRRSSSSESRAASRHYSGFCPLSFLCSTWQKFEKNGGWTRFRSMRSESIIMSVRSGSDLSDHLLWLFKLLDFFLNYLVTFLKVPLQLILYCFNGRVFVDSKYLLCGFKIKRLVNKKFFLWVSQMHN